MDELSDDQKDELFRIIQSGKIRKLTSFFNETENPDLDFVDETGKTPLMYAVNYEGKDDVRTHMVRTVLRHGCDANIQDGFGSTALMYSCMDYRSEDVTRLLTKKGNSDPNIQDNQLNTALMYAVMASNPAGLQILVTSSATRSKVNLDLQNQDGLTALELAIKLKMGECCKVLVQEGCADIRQTKDLKGLRMLLGTEVSSLGNEHTFLKNENHSLSTPVSARSVKNQSMSRCSTPVPDYTGHNSRISFVNDSPMSSRSHYSVSDNQSPRTYDISWAGSPRKIRRALTPLLRENAKILEAEDQNLFGHRARLPSIPSGKRLCMVNSASTYTTQTDDLNVA